MIPSTRRINRLKFKSKKRKKKKAASIGLRKMTK